MNPIDNPNEDTEFNDILRKHGVLPPQQEAPSSPSPPPSPTLSETLKYKSPDAIAALAEDANDSDEERAIQAYRRQRLAEIRKHEKASKFGDVIPISRGDYARAVTQASKEDEPDAEVKGLGTGVIVCLYKDGDPPSVQLLAQLQILAKRYPKSKFVSIVGNKCIEDYPDRLQPTLILYRAGEVTAQVVSWGKDRQRDPQELEALLVVSKVISVLDRALTEEGSTAKTRDDIDEEDTTMKSKGHQSSRVGGETTAEDDSDFDL